MTEETQSIPTNLKDVPGWFPGLDQALFTWFLEGQDAAGDLVEVGTFLGKSAILLGRHLRAGERFTVCDLFGEPGPDEANRHEQATSSYTKTLTRAGFEANYLAFHDTLPEVVQGPSTVIVNHVEPGSCRFVHIDASHLYEHVRADVASAHTMLAPGGIAVFDDYRTAHTPGTAMAVWEAVVSDGLRPICVSDQKLYGTWGDPDELQERLLAWLPTLWYTYETEQVGGRRLVRVHTPKGPDPLDARVRRLRRELRRTRAELAAVRGSTSFRVARALTAGPRAVRRLRDRRG